MPTLLRGGYAPPGVYTQTTFGTPPTPTPIPNRLPLFIGTGTEILYRSNLPVVRGSSSTIDQQVVDEDESGRAVLNVSPSGLVTIGDFDGTLTKFQVRNLPIVSGDGTGTPAIDTSAVSCRINGFPVVVLGLDALKGIVEIAVAPAATDIVRCTYYFDRTDTLTTDDVSDQVTAEAAVIDGLAGQNFSFTAGANDIFSLSVDGLASVNVTMPSSAPSISGAVVTATINGTAGIGSLVASTYVNNLGQVCIRLTADKSIVIGTGTSNTTLGFTPNAATSRNRLFYTFQGPIVDGTGGGLTTTDPSRIVVLVNGTQVIPTAVNGSARSFTLPFAPAMGSTVTVRYYFNTWQDTFDYLANIGVTAISRVALTPDGSTAGTFIQGVSYVLKDDVIVWGTSALISAGTHTEGGATLGNSQVQAMLVDNRIYLDTCAATVDNTSAVAVASRSVFQLSHQPTTGNGRGNPLGSVLYQTVANGRMDLPTNRPDLITAYWGFGVQDALNRGPVTITKVDSTTSQITLGTLVPEGATVYATYYYNTLVDMANIGASRAYTLKCVTAGPGGIGTYSLATGAGTSLFGVMLTGKGTDLSTVDIVFPSGSEFFPDARVEGAAPVEENVTVQFATSDETPARFTNLGPSPYYMIDNTSDHLRVTFNGVADQTGAAAGIDLSSPTGGNRAGAFASLLGNEVAYTAASGETTYTVTAGVDDAVNLVVDGVSLATVATAGVGTAQLFVDAINAAALTSGNEPYYNGAGVFTGYTLAAGEYDRLTLHYTGNLTGASGPQMITLFPGTYASVGALVTQINTQLATINGAGGLAGSVRATALASGQIRFTLGISKALGLFDFVAANPLDTETITIGTKTYTFQSILTDVDGNVQIGLTAADTRDNLVAAITLGVGAGAVYAASTTLHPTVTAVAGALDTMIVTAKVYGSAQNAIITTTTVTTGGLWAGATLGGGDDSGYLEFITDAAPAQDFAILAGIDTAALSGDQTKLYNGPIARLYTVTTAGRKPYDRVILRNRIFPGGNSVAYAAALAQTGITLQGGTGATKAGLLNGETAEAVYGANVKAPTLIAYTGWANGQASGYLDARDGQANVTFFDGSDPSNPANDLFTFTAGGSLVTVSFTSSTAGTDTAFGPVTVAGSVLGQINAAIVAAGLTATVQVRQEGQAIRLIGGGVGPAATLVIGAGSANDTLGFTEDDSASPVAVTARQTASALMNHAQAPGAFVTGTMLGYATPDATYFAGKALAGIETDATGSVYLYLQSQTLGVGSSIDFNNATSNNALVTGTMLLITSADGSSGEAAVNGFFVKSSNPGLGSGSANTSVFNSGVGQDGVVGQTYVDDVTGLTFTILPRTGGLSYPTGVNATISFRVSKTFTTDGNIPTLAVPGLELTVTNTSSVVVGDTAFVETFKKSGDEPTNGQIYYVSYSYTKQDFTPRFFSKLSDVVAEYGPVSPDNPLSLAAYIAFLNGSSVIATYQVLKQAGSSQASEQSYLDALTALEGDSLPGNISPTVLTFLTPATANLAKQTAIHCDIQSSIRYRSERTAIFGFASGTQPTQAGAIAQATGSTRVRFVYPDIATLTLTDVLGTSKAYLVDGRYIAVATAASTTAPSIDSATPWTGRLLSGFTALARSLDAVEANQVAARGVTVIEARLPFLRIRHGLTSDMSNVLTKVPTVIQIADDMQRRARAVLDPFIGVKFLPQILGQIEGQLSEMFKRAVSEQIITSFTGIKVSIDPEDPTAVLCEAFYLPVFPLLYIQISLRVSAQSNV